MQAPIESIAAREVFDSRGDPTIEVDVFGPGGVVGRASAPAGASTGSHEAVELRDGDARRFRGKGTLRAIDMVHRIIAPALRGRPLDDQAGIDRLLLDLDGTTNFSRLGANATLAVSLACAHAAARQRGVPLYRYLWSDGANLPLPMVNMISGGRHAGGQLEFQDFLALPVGADSLRQAIEWIVAVYRALGERLALYGYESVLVGDEGGYGPKLTSNREALDLLMAAIESTGLEPGIQVAIGLDVASTQFFRDGRYWLRLDRADAFDLAADDVIAMLSEWVSAYPIVSIEDGLAEDDWDGWRKLTRTLGDRVQLVGDDLLVTNPDRLRRGMHEGCANAILVKPNQIGTLTQTLEVLRAAQAGGYWTIVSARSGETEDSTIADLAVATGAGQIKIGSVARSERLAKYNQLLRIEEQLAGALSFPAGRIFQRLASE
jgi:enolase